MAIEPIKISARVVRMHKAAVNPEFKMRNVLTNSPWTYVDLWLRRNKKNDALLYWDQARQFYEASRSLPTQSAPLLLYYSYMNASKALLSAKGIVFHEHHGVRAYNMRQPGSKISLGNEGVRVLNRGIASEVSNYFQEGELSDTHSLEVILYNLVFIHRTYCLTYKSRSDMFFPLYDFEYVRDSISGEVYFRAYVSGDIAWDRVKAKLPPELIADPAMGERAIRSKMSVIWRSAIDPSEAELALLKSLHQSLRNVAHYINGSQTLWYVKTTGSNRLDRQPVTLMLLAMHRLSEICRYKPAELAAYLNGQKNWLLSEFITMSPTQFFDEISTELTGNQFMVPNVRAPS